MNQLALTQREDNRDITCGDRVAMAEREMSAFFKAVTELFGFEEAQVSAEDWLREVIAIDHLPASAGEWRSITVTVLSRLARRVTPPRVLAGLVNA